MFKFLERLEDYGRVPLRVGLGAMFLYTGMLKLLWFGAATDAFTGFGLTVPSPAFWVAIVMVAEILGGLLMVFGLLTRIAAAALTAVLFVAAIVLALKGAAAVELFKHAAWMGGTLALVLGGPGKWSLDYKLLLE